ncbi:MAG: Conserved putative secreted protein [Pseudonocardiales bacterium]|nr:Conserved putative secreted protein [Pseudonocardiales bacterium]
MLYATPAPERPMISIVRRMRRLPVAFAVLAVLPLAATTVSVPPAAVAATGGVYVALGDSYSAGPLILPMTDPLTCVRSAVDYPGLLAAKLHVPAFRDVTCSAATTSDFGSSQPGNIAGTAAPQYDAVTADATLVTVGIGGNDVGLVGLAESCINVLPAPLGTSCAAKYTAGGVDQYSRRIQAFASTYGSVIDTIHGRAPNARVVMVGYPTTIRDGGCWPVQPVLAPDATYIQAKVDELNAAMAREAGTHGATYVDLRSSSVGHDACALPGQRWVEGLVPLSDAFPLHPNELSMRNAANVIYADL